MELLNFKNSSLSSGLLVSLTVPVPSCVCVCFLLYEVSIFLNLLSLPSGLLYLRLYLQSCVCLPVLWSIYISVLRHSLTNCSSSCWVSSSLPRCGNTLSLGCLGNTLPTEGPRCLTSCYCPQGSLWNQTGHAGFFFFLILSDRCYDWNFVESRWVLVFLGF